MVQQGKEYDGARTGTQSAADEDCFVCSAITVLVRNNTQKGILLVNQSTSSDQSDARIHSIVV